MPNNPKVSVVMAVCNAHQYVGEAVESVLQQTFTDFEFIIIDDGSTDDSGDVLRRYVDQDRRIQLVEQENRGLPPSLNRGLAMSRGKYVARMDADDVCLPRRFELQVNYLDSHPQCVVVGGDVKAIDEKGDSISSTDSRFAGRLDSTNLMKFPRNHDTIENWLLTRGWAFIHPAVMMRRNAIEKVGGYDPKIKDAEDLDLFIRLAEVGQMANLPAVLLKYRCHSTQISSTSPVQNYWSKRARRAGYQRRGLPLPEELRLPAIIQSAIGKELRKRELYQPVVRLFSRFL